MKENLVIATRSSQLALRQAEWVKARVNRHFPDVKIHLSRVKTKGDKILDTSLTKIGGKGLFVKELEVAILNQEADIAVHSMKDVPITCPPGLEISVITRGETPNDAFVSNQYNSFQNLPEKAVVGTSSLRRVAQLKKARPDLRFESLRGNVNTRLRKLDEGRYDAIILAMAGLIRLEMEDRITEKLSYDLSLPAIGQGVVCIESRRDDNEVLELIRPLIDSKTRSRIRAERALLCRLNAGCQIPLAGFSTLENGIIELSGLVASEDGKTLVKVTDSAPESDAEALGVRVAEKLLENGAREILENIGIEVD